MTNNKTFADISFININFTDNNGYMTASFYNCNFFYDHKNYFICGTWFMDSPILGTTFDNSILTQNNMLDGVIYTVSCNWTSSWVTFTNPTGWMKAVNIGLTDTNTTINLKDNWNHHHFYLDNL